MLACTARLKARTWQCWQTHASLITCVLCFQSLVIPEKFQHILRVLNTNIDGRRKIAFAITAIKVKSHLCFMLHFLQVTRMHLSMFVAQLLLRVSVVCQTFIITLTCLSFCLSGLRVLADVTPMLSWGRPTSTSTRGLESWLMRRWGEPAVCRHTLRVDGYRIVSEGNVVALQEVLDCVNRWCESGTLKVLNRVRLESCWLEHIHTRLAQSINLSRDVLLKLSVQTESFSYINHAYFLPAASKLFHVGFLIAQIAAAVWWINDIINFWLWTNNTCHWLEVLKTKNVNKQQRVTASLNLSWCWFSHSGAVTFQQEVDHVRLPRRVVLFIGYLITRPGEHALLLKTSVK